MRMTPYRSICRAIPPPSFSTFRSMRSPPIESGWLSGRCSLFVTVTTESIPRPCAPIFFAGDNRIHFCGIGMALPFPSRLFFAWGIVNFHIQSTKTLPFHIGIGYNKDNNTRTGFRFSSESAVRSCPSQRTMDLLLNPAGPSKSCSGGSSFYV